MVYHFVLFILRKIVTFWFRIRIYGRENLRPETQGRPVLYIANHVSWLDALFMVITLPPDVPFVILRSMEHSWWAKLLKKYAPEPIPVDPASPYAVRDMVHALTHSGQGRLALFPEGRLSVTGSLMRIRDGAGMIAIKTNAVIVPLYLEGVEHVMLNRLAGKVRRFLRPQITITIGKPCSIEDDGPLPADQVTPRQLRTIASTRIEAMLSRTGITEGSQTSAQEMPPAENLTASFFKAGQCHGWSRAILDDIRGANFTYRKLSVSAIALGRALACRCTPSYDTAITSHNAAPVPVGVLLPNAAGTIAAMLGLTFQGRIFHPMNFSTGPAALTSISQTLRIKHVVTAKGFIEKAKLDNVTSALEKAGCSVHYLEDIVPQITLKEKLKAFALAHFPRLLPGMRVSPESILTILATSGSEGAPKGVALTHTNMLTNVRQITRAIDVSSADRLLNAMPVFHSFGLLGGVILPLMQGVWSYQYPTPLHGRVIPALTYDLNITIAFSTNTFLNLWARNADPYDFYRMRAIVAGAEAVRSETADLFARKFGVRVLEGYGATETSPVISLNTFRHARPGTVGRILPGMSARLEDVPGITDGKRLLVRGPNIMAGYILASEPGILQPAGEWYDTGDIVSIDDGFITIKGRAKRFSKIAGEMVSMTAVENLTDQAFADDIDRQRKDVGPGRASQMGNAVIALPDERKGEKLVWFTTLPVTNEKEAITRLAAAAKEKGMAELSVPRIIRTIDKLPLLGTGKINYPELEKKF